MRNVLNEVFPDDESFEEFFEPLIQKEENKRRKLELGSGLNLLLLRVLASDKRFNRMLTAFDINVKDANELMVGTVRHLKKTIKGGNNG